MVKIIDSNTIELWIESRRFAEATIDTDTEELWVEIYCDLEQSYTLTLSPKGDKIELGERLHSELVLFGMRCHTCSGVIILTSVERRSRDMVRVCLSCGCSSGQLIIRR